MIGTLSTDEESITTKQEHKCNLIQNNGHKVLYNKLTKVWDVINTNPKHRNLHQIFDIKFCPFCGKDLYENYKQSMGVKLKCNRCENIWIYKGKNPFCANCSRCKCTVFFKDSIKV